LPQAEHRSAIALFCGQQLLFAGEILVVHRLAPDIGLVLLALLRSIGGFVLVLAVACGRPPWRSHHPLLQAARCAATLIAVWLAYVLYRSPLLVADISAISYLQSFFLAIYGMIWLAEPVSRHQWLAISLGFAGALLIIRPGLTSFGPFYALAVAQAAANACQVLLTRKIQRPVAINGGGGPSDSALTILFWVSVSGIAVNGALAPFAGWPDNLRPAAALTVMTLGPLGIWLGILAVRWSALAALAPFRYVQLPVTGLFGFLLFNEIPDLSSIAGALTIVAACLLQLTGPAAGDHEPRSS
jgi:drug/metabolite transporter (DMT)-like permease